VLSIAERKHNLEELSLPRVALWGGIGGMIIVVPAMFLLSSMGMGIGGTILPLAVNGLTGAGFASGSVALARRADANLIETDDSRPFLKGDG
jgi:hypothetical protein